MNIDAVKSALSHYQDPWLQTDLVSAKCLKHAELSSQGWVVQIDLPYPARSQAESCAAAVRDALLAAGLPVAEIRIGQNIQAHAVQRGIKRLPSVRNIIAVASGKGGVGKSTTAVNLALALAHEGARVGILDADIYGPSQPTLLGVSGKPESVDGKSLQPMQGLGLEVMSIGFLIQPDSPMVWRGPMVAQALEQLLNETRWGDLDYLVVDMPPGTGDAQLTLSQKVPVTGAVIVTTPQDLALIDARKGYRMFEKVGVPVVGVIENMAVHICSNCGHEEHIFGQGGGARMAEDFGLSMLGALPLDLSIRVQADGGKPTVAADPESLLAKRYREIAMKVAASVALKARDHSSRFPSIVVQDT